MTLLRSLPRLRALLAVAAAAIVAAACTATADDAAPPDEQAAPAADGTAVERPARAAATPSAAAATAAQAEPVEPARPAATIAVRAAVGATPRKDLAVSLAGGALDGPLAKAFYTFADYAALEFAPELLVAWGLGAPRGEYVISASIWSADDKLAKGSAGGASRLASAELRSGGSLRSDDAIRAVEGATAERAWLEAFGEAGAHGVTYDLLLWDGAELVAVVGHFTAAPGNVVAPGAAAQLRDLDGDDDPELVIDRTDPYLFYYTSQIWHADAAVLRREGDEFREVTLAAPDASVGAEALSEAAAALDFAAAGWWARALERAEAAAALAPDDETLRWNAIVLRERSGAALREAERSSVGWLGALLAGEWRGAIGQLRGMPHVGWLSLEGVLRDTPLAGLEAEVAELVLQRGTAALMAAERLPVQDTAPVYLLRGLARWWLGEGMLPAAIDLVEAIPGYWRETTVFDLLWGIGYRGG